MTNHNTSIAGQGVSVDAIIHIAIAKYANLQRFMRRFERDPFLAEDLVQNVFVEVIKSASRYNGRSSPETWIFGIAANLGRNHSARMYMRRVCGREVQMEEEDIELQGVDTSFMDNLITAERLRQIQAEVATMSVPMRMTFELVFLNSWTYQQTADFLNVPIGTVRSRTSRLRELLQPLNPEFL